ncbi:MAG: hypothetical protein KBA51_02145 [Kiritimatiellae bacterium]|nr:hypothetical protein [Kiritimatiellia bacterium]
MNTEFLVGATMVTVSLGGTLLITFRNIARSRGRARTVAIRACFIMFLMMAAFIFSLVYLDSPWRFVVGALWLAAITVVHYRSVVQYQILLQREQELEKNEDA